MTVERNYDKVVDLSIGFIISTIVNCLQLLIAYLAHHSQCFNHTPTPQTTTTRINNINTTTTNNDNNLDATSETAADSLVQITYCGLLFNSIGIATLMCIIAIILVNVRTHAKLMCRGKLSLPDSVVIVGAFGADLAGLVGVQSRLFWCVVFVLWCYRYVTLL